MSKKALFLFVFVLLIAQISTVFAEGIGTADNPVKVTILIKDVIPTEPDTMAYEKAIEEGLAAEGNYIDLEFLESPAGKYIDVVPLAFRTGEINPDIIYFQGNTDAPVVAEGLLEDLTPYIADSKYINAAIGEHTKTRLANQPYLLWIAPAKVMVPVMRKDFFDTAPSSAAFLADPTPEAYKKLLQEVVDAGNAKFGFALDGNLSRLNSVFNQAFGVKSTIMKEGDKYVFSMASEAEKNKLAFYADLYKAGLIDPDYITKAWDTMEQAFYEGQAAMLAGTAGDVVQIYNTKMTQTNGANAELVALPPAKGVDWSYVAVDVTKEERGFAINATIDENVKKAAFAVLDFMASPAGRLIDKAGVEDVQYTKENNMITFKDTWSSYWSRMFPSAAGLPEDVTFATPIYSVPALESLKLASEYYKEDINVLVPEELLPQYTAIVSLYNEFANDVVRGVKTIDDFDSFVTEFNNLGGTAFSDYFATVLP